MRKKLLLQEQPDPFHGVKFRSAGRQRFEGYIGRDAQGFCLMPSGLIENQKDMLVRANRFGELVEIDLHGVCRNFGQDEREGVIRARLHCPVDIGEGIALIASPRWPPSFREPAVTDAPLLANARFILKKEADFLVRMGFANLFQALGEPPLKASCAASSFSGWWGRAFCREKPSRLMATDMDQG